MSNMNFRVAYRKTKRGSIIKVREVESQQNPNIEDTKFQYPKHLTPDEVKQGLESGRLLSGKFQGSRDNTLEGYVSVIINDEDVHVLIQGRDCLNRAIHDDEVAIELLPKSEWRHKSDLVLLPEENAEQEPNDDEVVIAAKKLKLIEKGSNIKPTGKIVAISKRVWRNYTGVLRQTNPSAAKSFSSTRCLFVASDRRIPIIRIQTRQYDVLKNQRLVVAIDSWPRASRYPQGHYVKRLGTIGDKDTENQVLLLEHDVPHQSFTEAVLACLPPEGSDWTIPEVEFKRRKDLRGLDVCSVDPPGCTDIDDALHFRNLDEATCEVGVHIADVSHYVKPGTPMDREAANRGTTVYLSDRRIDMIPELLSSNLCSLIQHVDRLAFSVIWKIKKSTGQILDVQFMKTIIKSRASLTYEAAQSMIDDKKNNGPIHSSLRGLMSLAKKFKQKRLDRGALVLARADEVRFVETESETHERDANFEIQLKKLVDTNSMVEEFMLLANITVANKLLESYPQQALLRRHPKPSRANFDDLIQSAKLKGFDIIAEDGRHLSQTLDKAKLPNNEFFNLMLRMIATRCMTPAAYFCSGYVDPNTISFSHFGLAADLYTHFTSPIRRYADLLVHRLLASAIKYGQFDKSLADKNNIQMICDQINYRHRNAQLASRASAKLHTVLYIKSKQNLVEDAYVFYVRQNALQILIPSIAFEYTYFLQPGDDWLYDVTQRSQTHVVKKVSLRQFDKLRVHVFISKKEDLRFSDKIQVKILNPPLDVDDSAVVTADESILNESNLIDEDMQIEYRNDGVQSVMIAEESAPSYLDMRKKIRLDLIKSEQSKPVIVMPGDHLDKYVAGETTMLGPGLIRTDNRVVATKGGIMKIRGKNLLWIDSHQKRYVATRGECIIGIVRSKGSLQVRLDINSAELATLSLLAFEGASKRNKPNLNVGDLVYGKVISASKHVETEVVCVNSLGKRDGLGIIGDKGGHLITLSIDTIRVLLSPRCDFIEQLGRIYRYEIALGMNGRVWINSSEVATIIKVANELRRFGLD